MVWKPDDVNVADDLKWTFKVISTTGNLSRANILRNTAYHPRS